MATTYQIDPIADTRWERLSLRHPNASVFHSPGWLKALRDAYGYEPMVLTTTPPGRELVNGMVFCRVRSWLTGNRLVSVPFSDHCEPLLDSPEELGCMLSGWAADPRPGATQYIEIRPMTAAYSAPPGFTRLIEFRLHRLDLTPSANDLFRGFHKNIQRNIRRSEGKFLRYVKGTSGTLLEDFRRLLTQTRKRHSVPPQPLRWFRSLFDCMGERASIHLAYKDLIPIAGILTLRHGNVMVCKYSCMDSRYRQFGGVAPLLWRSMQEARQEGVHDFDFGRSDLDNAGLITFKERWGSIGSALIYWSCGERRFDGVASQWASQCLRQMIPYLPDGLVTATGNFFYKHVG